MLSFQNLPPMNLTPLACFSKTFCCLIISKSHVHESHTPHLWGGGEHFAALSFQNLLSMNHFTLSYFQKHFAVLSFCSLTSMNLQHAPRLCHTQVDLINAPAYKPRQETNGPTPVTQGLQQQVHNNPQIWDFQQRLKNQTWPGKQKIFSSVPHTRDCGWGGCGNVVVFVKQIK